MIPRLRTAAAGLLLLSVLAACSAAGAAPSGVASLASQGADGAEPSASLAPEDAMLAFAKCMRDEGIDMPDPETVSGPGGGGGAIAFGASGDDQEAFQAAMEACDEFLQQARGARGEIDQEQMDRMLEFAGCMRDHGIPMPDPNADGGIMIERNDDGSVTSGGDRIDPSSPEFQEAQEACQPILGDDFGGPRTQTGTGGDSGSGVEIAPEPAQ
jgi:hypothetical protein